MATLNDVVRVFISSKQLEFAEERRGMMEVVQRLPLLAVDIAEDWAPGRDTAESTYLARVRAAPIYVGLFGCVYSASTEQEYDAAIENPYREVLTYVKQCERVEPPLAALIRRFEDPTRGHTTKHFDSWADLKPHFERHLWSAVQRMIEHYLRLADPAPVARGGSSVMLTRWLREQRYLQALGLPGGVRQAEARSWAAQLGAVLTQLRDASI